MTKIRILHISDLHLGSSKNLRELTDVVEMVADCYLKGCLDGETKVLIISGDITTAGRTGPYNDALKLLSQLAERIQPSQIICCPGNHDITTYPDGKRFDAYNKFCLSLTSQPEQLMGSTRTSSLILNNVGLNVISINSAHHLDHTYGEVPARMHAVVHHPLVSSSSSGPSIRNSSEVLAELCQHGVSGILHGHGHGESVLRVGSGQTPILGVGSLLFPPVGNLNNQFGVYEFDDGTLESASVFRRFADKPEQGFLASEMVWL